MLKLVSYTGSRVAVKSRTISVGRGALRLLRHFYAGNRACLIDFACPEDFRAIRKGSMYLQLDVYEEIMLKMASQVVGSYLCAMTGIPELGQG